jgi:hypothetical protein
LSGVSAASLSVMMFVLMVEWIGGWQDRSVV